MTCKKVHQLQEGREGGRHCPPQLRLQGEESVSPPHCRRCLLLPPKPPGPRAGGPHPEEGKTPPPPPPMLILQTGSSLGTGPREAGTLPLRGTRGSQLLSSEMAPHQQADGVWGWAQPAAPAAGPTFPTGRVTGQPLSRRYGGPTEGAGHDLRNNQPVVPAAKGVSTGTCWARVAGPGPVQRAQSPCEGTAHESQRGLSAFKKRARGL